MATYLQSVTDFIPQLQPFQPDLNFYGNVMQTKQTQYDTNWQALNKMYGQYYHADLTRDGNIAKKDNYLKQIEFNLKRVSQLDLSLEQNVTQATQIFKPFYEDKSLVKDMAWTKNFNNQMNRAEIFKLSSDEKDRAQYWETGVREMQYLKDEFKTATESEAMNFSNVEYTPYVNTIERAQKVAKESGLSVESVDFSRDGRWIVKTKNGEQLIEPLQKLFEAQLGSDPAIQAVYKTQAFVDRKDYAYSNAAQFGGDKNKAEMKYLENSFNILKEKSTARYKALQAQSKLYDSKIADIEKQIKDGDASPEAAQALSQYKMNKDINDKVLARSEQEQKDLNGGQSSTATTSNGFVNPYGDIKSLRWKVDNGMASLLMQKDLDEAANIFAFKDAKQDIDANPYAVLADKHKYSMQQIAARNQGIQDAARIRNQGERKNKLDEARIKAGTHVLDEQTGEVVAIEAFEKTYVEPNDKGTATDQINLRTTNDRIAIMQTNNVAIPYLTNTVALMERLIIDGKMTRKEASQILSYSKEPNVTLEKFNDKLNKYGTGWVRKGIGANDLNKIKVRMNAWLNQNGQLSTLTGEEYKAFRKSAMDMGDYINYLNVEKDWRKVSSKEAEAELKRQGFKYADFLYDEKGNLRTEAEFYAVLSKQGKISLSEAKGNMNQSKIYNIMSPNIARVVAAGSPVTGAVVSGIIDSANPNINYNEMVAAANKAYTTGKVKQALPGLDKFGTLDGTGKFTPGITATWVNPKAHTKSTAYFGELLFDLNKFDWGGTDKNRVSFLGTSKNAFDNSKDYNNKGKALLDQIRAEMSRPGSTKMGNFRVGVSPIAAGSMNKAAIVIYPDANWLKQYVYKYDPEKGKKTSTGMISETEYDAIMQNGISYITNASNMTNSMYKSAFQSPLQSYVDYNESYTYTDPTNSNYSFTIAKSNIGTGDYMTTLKFPVWNPEENKYEIESITDNMSVYGSNLEEARYSAIDIFDHYKQLNKQIYNGRY